MKMVKRIFSALLALCLVMGLLPGAASAEEQPLTRAGLCTLIVDALGLRYDESMEVHFDDVDPTADYYEAVAIMVSKRLMPGTSSNDFSPDLNISRAMMAAIIYRMGISGPSPETIPYDVREGSWYTEGVLNALGSGVMSVYPDGLFHPDNNAYPRDIHMDVLLSILGQNTTDLISLDLSQGSIGITENIMGLTVYRQGETELRTDSRSAIVRQSDTAAPTTNTISVSRDDVTLILAGVDISAGGINAYGDVTLSLTGENRLESISVLKGATLSIQGNGSCDINGWISNNGSLVINGGTVRVEYSGGGGGGTAGGGTVVINDGNVTVEGGLRGKKIDINGGTVTSRGTTAGIVCGEGEVVTITGGTVIAEGTDYNAVGIGNSGTWACGTIVITGGSVTAAGDSVSIGGGSLTRNETAGEAITIGENAALTLIQRNSDGADYHERIINLELTSTAANLGSPLGMWTDASGHSGLSYQWQISPDNETWTDLDGQTAPICLSPMTAQWDGYYFRCRLTNAFGNVVCTESAQGYVLAFSRQPESVDVSLNEVVSLSVASTCTNVSYRWEQSYDDGVSWSAVPGEVYATLVVSDTGNKNGTLYRCTITAENGDTLTSDSARITADTGDAGYTVRYYQENPDGSGYTAVDQEYLIGAFGQNVSAPNKSYDGFSENTEKGTHSGVITADGLILSRYFDRNTYQIDFEMNGAAAFPSVSAKYGASIQSPADPSRYGYVFEGWFADPALTREYVFSTMPLNGATLYAKWRPKGEGRGMEYRIEEIVVRDESTHEALTGLLPSNLLVEVSVTNLASREMDTIVLAAYDKAGRMLDLHYMYANPTVGQNIVLGTLVKNQDGAISRFKAFVLPTLGNPIPLAPSVEWAETAQSAQAE